MAAAGIDPEYLELVRPDTMVAVPRIAGDVLAVVAARFGPVRLIDNLRIDTAMHATNGSRLR